jgi:asparagine synthase (glutamine-hydrolysing)
MGSIVAAVSKNSPSVFDEVYTMLKSLEHRGSDAFGIGSSRLLIKEPTLDKLSKPTVSSPSLIAHGLTKLLPHDIAQPIKVGDSLLVFEGRGYPSSTEGSIRQVSEEIRDTNRLLDQGTDILRRINGAYAFAILEKNRIVAGRDPLGLVPLYFGESQNCYALASERKALWKIGIIKTQPLPLGHIALINAYGYKLINVKPLLPPSIEKWTIDDAALHLEELLRRSIADHTCDLKKIAIGFSGGLDSSILASLITQSDLEIVPIYVTLERQKETDYARQAARALNIPLQCFEYSINDVAEMLPKIIWLTEEANPVNIPIALSTLWIAEQASAQQISFLMTGQGADELFGGYHRYLQVLTNKDFHGLEEKLVQDVLSSSETNCARDNKVCAYKQIELRNTFIDWNITTFSLSLPAQLKITTPNDLLRKKVLRTMARKIGLPELITERPKKAIQYSTGVNHAIRKIAREEGQALHQYLQAMHSTLGGR